MGQRQSNGSRSSAVASRSRTKKRSAVKVDIRDFHAASNAWYLFSMLAHWGSLALPFHLDPESNSFLATVPVFPLSSSLRFHLPYKSNKISGAIVRRAVLLPVL